MVFVDSIVSVDAIVGIDPVVAIDKKLLILLFLLSILNFQILTLSNLQINIMNRLLSGFAALIPQNLLNLSPHFFRTRNRGLFKFRNKSYAN